MRFRSLISGAALVLFAAGASPGISAEANGIYGVVGDWRISKFQSTEEISQCSAMLNDGIDVLTIIYAPFSKRMALGFSLYEGANFNVGDEINVSTRYVSTKDGEVDGYDSPALVRAGSKNLSDSRLVWQPQIQPEHTLDLLKKHRYVGFYLTESMRKLTIMKLDDSAKAVALLRECTYSLKRQ